MAELTQAVAHLNAAVVAKAIAEPEFRAQLLADPKTTVEKAFGAPLPEGTTLKVVEATPSQYTIVLPYQAQSTADGELSDADLETVAGGSKGGFMNFIDSINPVSHLNPYDGPDQPVTLGSAAGSIVGGRAATGGGSAVSVACQAATIATGQQ